jgi:hypothetical protein
VFNYPLTAEEISERLHYTHASPLEIKTTLKELVQDELLGENNGLYFIVHNNKAVERRKWLNERAEPYYGKGKLFSKLISYFPFVEGVFITGSLAKGCMDEKGDIDYLIITKPGRLWLCRGILVTFKKLFLFNSRKYFCVNYYVDSDTLQIPDQNIFAATEIIHALPAYNPSTCNKFFDDNKWIHNYYPNKPKPGTETAHDKNTSVLKRGSEFLFNGWLGEKADELFLRLFVWRWKSKFKHLEDKQFEVNFRSRKNVSKHHPQGFQFKVLNALQQKMADFEARYNVKL